MPDLLEQPAPELLESGIASARKLRILRLVVSVGECNAAYNQFTLPVRDRYETTICSYFPATTPIVDDVQLREGDGTIRGYKRMLRATLDETAFDIVHAHSPQLACIYLMANMTRPSRLRNFVMTAHNSYKNFKPRNRLMLLPGFLMGRRTIICGVEAGKSFPWPYRLFAAGRMRSVANGVDLTRVDAAIGGLSNDPQGGFQVISVGRVIPIKDPGTAYWAFAEVARDGDRLTFVGEGNLRDEVSRQATSTDLGNQVEVTGIVPRVNVFERLCEASLFISTSHGEGLPMAVLEAMACRCPVLLSDIPPHREIASGTDFIPLVEPGDVQGFAREIQRFQTMPEEERRQVGEQCRRHVEDNFSLESMHAGYAAIYQEVISNAEGKTAGTSQAERRT